MNIIIYTSTGKAPLPEGWTVERACEVLRETGHTIQRIEADGVVVQPEEAA